MKPTVSILAGSLFLASVAHAQEPAPPPPLPPLTSPAPSMSSMSPVGQGLGGPAVVTPTPAAPMDPIATPDSPPPPVTTPPRFHDLAPESPPENPRDDWSPPRASTGFQAALRVGAMLPMGSTTGASGDDLSALFGTQVGLRADIGGKPSPNVYLGVYGVLGLGGGGNELTNICSAISCSATSIHVGLDMQYHFNPGGLVNPWIGYGAGYETASLSESNDATGANATIGVNGWEFADLSFGLDFRVANGVGLGPVIDLSMGQYSNESFSTTNVVVSTPVPSGSIESTALHEWLTLGMRVVFNP